MNEIPLHIDDGPPVRAASLLRRLGRLGFWFFLVKGLLWLAVPAAIWRIGT